MRQSDSLDVWRARLADYSTRTGSKREWCRDNGVSAWQLKYWRARVRDEPSSEEGSSAPALFTPVAIVADEIPVPVPVPGAGVTVLLGPARVEVQPGFDQTTLARTLRVVASSLMGGAAC